MTDRLPPLTALRAFDAAARHLSFAMAAAELNVTPAALSFQIKSLEEHLGAPVFRRLNRAVELTEAGQALAPGARDGFITLRSAWRNAQRALNSSVITITAGPAFTAKWLAPRLFDFARAHPSIELRFVASLKLMDFKRDAIDLAIRFGLPHADQEQDLYAEALMGEWFTPMMHPSLSGKYQTPEALRHAPLLHQDDTNWLTPPCDWRAWFAVQGLEAQVEQGARFSQADHALDAAQAGAGVVLGRVSLADRALRQGHLVAPFASSLKTDAHYRVLCPEGTQNKPHIQGFLTWLRDQFAALEEHDRGREFAAIGRFVEEKKR